MSDVFISYARSTATQAQAIAEALRALGYGVWRDDDLPAHKPYAEVIAERLAAAKAVVVIWSAEAAKSEWVQSEADRARTDRKLVQLRIDGAALPMPFDRIQCADLAGWAGDLAAHEWRKVTASIAELAGGAGAAASTSGALIAEPAPASGGRGNLPTSATSFLGREKHVADIAAKLTRERLVTLTGVGGVGKTRLAIETAAQIAQTFPDGAWLVELAALRDPSATALAIAGVFGIVQQPGASVERSIVDWLGRRRLLIVLDNCEHLIDSAAALASEIIAHCPLVTLLATSREALMIDGEHLWGVPSLDVAGEEVSPAVELFADRASAVDPNFMLAEHIEAVRDICRRLDGIPLAIELAAARVRAMSPTQIRDRLEERFRLLTGGSRRALERHQSLRQAVLWSFDLLNDAERLTLARTAVFAGEFTLEDSEAICAGEGVNDVDVVDLLDSLVRKSLITAIHVGPVVRYRLFETIRQFAEEHLESLGEREAVSLRHARRYADESIRQFEVWRSPKEPEAYAWLEIAIDNLRAAFSWACEHDEVDIAATIASNVGDMARVRLRGEAAGWAGEILSRARQVEHRRLVVLLTWATSTAWSLGRLEEATRLGEEAVALIDDARFDPFAWAFTDLATVAMLQNDPERVLKWSRAGAAHPADGRDQFCRAFLGYFETMAGRGTEAMEMASLALSTVEAAGGMPTPIAIAHLSRGYAASEADLEIAISEFERSFDMARKSGNRLIEVLAATSLAALVARQGDPAVALKGLLKAIDLCLGVSDVAVIYQGLASLAVALGRTGDHLGAATVAGAIGSDVRPQAYLGLAQAIDEALASLGRAARDAATVRGQAMSRGELMDYARSRVEDALAKLAATSAVA